jgi:hypothetical protein
MSMTPQGGRSAHVAHDADERHVIDLSDLNDIRRADKRLTRRSLSCTLIRNETANCCGKVIASGAVASLFVIV